jgi:MFS family permease
MSVGWGTMRPMSSRAPGLVAFWRELPTAGRWLLSTVAVQTLGRGLTLPFTIIYLHEVRGFELGTSGALMALIAVVALLVTAPGGSMTDRYGARLMLMAGSVFMVTGLVLLAFAATPAAAAFAFLLIGVNWGVSWPALNVLVATVVQGDLRQRYFGVNFALVNLGIGVGGVVGGFYVDVSRPATFTAIFLANAATMTVPLVLLLGPLRHLHGRAEAPSGGTDHPATYLRILRQPTVAWLTVITFLAMFIGYGQLEAGFPAFAREFSEVSTRVIGLAFAVNTVVIVSLQFWVLNRISGHRRTRVIMGMGLVWAVAWLVLGSTGLVPGGAAAILGVLLYHAVFAFGETLLQPTIPAITNDLAPDHLRGRYNAINSGAFQAGTIAGPAAAGVLLQHDLAVVYVGLMVAGCLAIVAIARVLERRVTPEANGVRPPVGTAAGT